MMTGQAIVLGPEVGTVTIMCRRIFHGTCALSSESDDLCHHTRTPRLQPDPTLDSCEA